MSVSQRSCSFGYLLLIRPLFSHSLFPNCSVVTAVSVCFNQVSHPALYCSRVNQSGNHVFPSTFNFFTKGASPLRVDECINTASLSLALMKQGLTAWGYVSLLRPWDSDYGQCLKPLMCKHTHTVTDTHIHHHMPVFCQVKVERVGQARHGSLCPWAPAGCHRRQHERSVISPFLLCTSFPRFVPPLSLNTDAHSCSAADAWLRCWHHTF